MLDYSQYQEKTRSADWKGICSAQGIDFDSFWTKREFLSLAKFLHSSEVVYGFTAGTVQVTISGKSAFLGKDSWLITLTNERLILISESSSKGVVKRKSLDIAKISGMVASQNKALGQLVVVTDDGIVVISEAMVDTVKNVASLYNQIKTVGSSKKELPTEDTPTHSPSSSNLQEDSVQEETSRNPFADDAVNVEDDSQDYEVNASIAVVVALLLGGVGVHDFVWGSFIFGIEKVAFAIAAWRTYVNGHEIISALFVLGISIWIVIDIFRMLNGKFFRRKTCSEVPQALRVIVIIVCIVVLLFNAVGLISEISDNAKKDHGGHVYDMEIISAYNQNVGQAKMLYENRRFSLIGQVESVEKDVWGDYEISLESYGLGYGNSVNKVKGMKLSFSNRQSKDILRLGRGDRFAASCIGRGLSSGFYIAEKCVLKHVVQ